MANKVQDKLRSMMKKEQIKNSITDALCFGRIVKENPIVIMLNDKIPLEANDLIIPEDLLEHTETVTARTSVNGEHSHSHTISNENEHKHEIKEPIHDKLKVDDQVVLLKINDKFIIISKVVKI